MTVLHILALLGSAMAGFCAAACLGWAICDHFRLDCRRHLHAALAAIRAQARRCRRRRVIARIRNREGENS